MRTPHLILATSPLQWLFDKGHDPEINAHHVHGVVSAAYDLAGFGRLRGSAEKDGCQGQKASHVGS